MHQRPGQRITLRNGIRVVRSTDGDRRLKPDGLMDAGDADA